MYSRSLPPKHAKIIPPLYSVSNSPGQTYCHTCGRIITSRCKNASLVSSTPVKYCSNRCRYTKPGPTDRLIEEAIVALLEGGDPENMEKYWAGDEKSKKEREEVDFQHVKKRNRKKGDSRIIVYCSEIQAVVFGHQFDSEKLNGKRGSGGSRSVVDFTDWRSVDMEDTPDHLKPSVTFLSERLEENEEKNKRREQGQKRAEEREMVRRAARRGVAFGFTTQDMSLPTRMKNIRHNGKKKQAKKDLDSTLIDEEMSIPKSNPGQVIKKCEAVMTDTAIVVEPSFAKGDWGIRWRED